jgi:hypothetical protein
MNSFSLFVMVLTVSVAALANSPASLTEAYQRENSFLAMQKDNLQRQGRTGLQRHEARLAELKAELIALERKALQLTAENDKKFQNLQDLQQRRKLEASRDMSLLTTLKKAKARNFEVEKSLRFETAVKAEVPEPAKVSVAEFTNIVNESLQLLQKSVETAEIQGAYLDAAGELREGKILRHGRGAAHLISDSKLSVLAPDGKGQLRVVETVQAQTNLLPIYIFESLNQLAVIKKAAGWTEIFADAVPAIFLLLMFFMVSGLFFVFVRE